MEWTQLGGGRIAPGGGARRSASGPRKRLVTLVLAIAGALLLVLPAAALAAPTMSLTAGFAEGAHLGEASSLMDTIGITGTEYGGSPLPLSELTLRAPKGTVLSNAGFQTCSEETLRLNGPAACPSGSKAGPVASFSMVLAFGAERVAEQGQVESFFSPGGGLILYLSGHSPVFLEVLAMGTYVAPVGAFGPGVQFQIPAIETVPGASLASFTELSVSLGAFRGEVGSVTAPAECTGELAWEAAAKFSDRKGAEATASKEAHSACPAAGKRAPSTTKISVSRTSLVEEEADLYTATVLPTNCCGVAPTGTVSFEDDGFTVFGCEHVALTPSGSAASATCEAFAFFAGMHEIVGVYGGNANYSASESAAADVTVIEAGVAEEEALRKHREEAAAKHKAEEAAAAKAAEEAAAKKHAEEAAAKKHAEEAAAKQRAEEASQREQQFASAAAALPGLLAPRGRNARIAALLKHGGFAYAVSLPAGTALTIAWYVLPKGAHLSARKPLLLAAGSVAASGKLTLKLTGAGRKLLRRSRTLKVTVRAELRRTAGAPAVRLASFSLKR